MSDEQKTAKEIEREAAEAAAKKENDSRSGVGTRKMVGFTRGKASMLVNWEAFDESKPETLPTAIQQFADITGTKDEATLVTYLIAGYNEASYIAASDPLAEYVDATWPPDAQAQFRLVTRNYARGAQVSLEDAVALIKPGFDKQFGK